jgi:ATP-dependent HslUV protease subunit HslV
MAADSAGWASGFCYGPVEKLMRASDGTLFGVAGDAAQCAAFLKWVKEGRDRGEFMPAPRLKGDDTSSIVVMIVVPDVDFIELLSATGSERIHMPYFALGAGAQCAMGALHAGASAVEAIDAAIAHGDGAIGPVQSICHLE